MGPDVSFNFRGYDLNFKGLKNFMFHGFGVQWYNLCQLQYSNALTKIPYFGHGFGVTDGETKCVQKGWDG